MKLKLPISQHGDLTSCYYPQNQQITKRTIEPKDNKINAIDKILIGRFEMLKIMPVIIILSLLHECPPGAGKGSTRLNHKNIINT